MVRKYLGTSARMVVLILLWLLDYLPNLLGFPPKIYPLIVHQMLVILMVKTLHKSCSVLLFILSEPIEEESSFVFRLRWACIGHRFFSFKVIYRYNNILTKMFM